MLPSMCAFKFGDFSVVVTVCLALVVCVGLKIWNYIIPAAEELLNFSLYNTVFFKEGLIDGMIFEEEAEPLSYYGETQEEEEEDQLVRWSTSPVQVNTLFMHPCVL